MVHALHADLDLLTGRFEECATALERMRRLERTVTLPQSDVAILGAELPLHPRDPHPANT